MVIQTINIIVSVCLPVVIIHLKGSAFSISKYAARLFVEDCLFKVIIAYSGCNNCVFLLFCAVLEALELRAD